MAEMSAAEMQAVIVQQQRQLKEFEARQTDAAADAAISTALDSAGVEFASGAARQQLSRLLRSEIDTYTSDGKVIVSGPAGRSVQEHVRERLQSDDLVHFRRTGHTGKTQQMAGGIPAPQGPTFMNGNVEQGANESFGAAIVRGQAGQRISRGNPQLDPALPFGLKRQA